MHNFKKSVRLFHYSSVNRNKIYYELQMQNKFYEFINYPGGGGGEDPNNFGFMCALLLVGTYFYNTYKNKIL